MAVKSFVSAAAAFRGWIGAFNPAECTGDEVVEALELVLDRAPPDRRKREAPPPYRIYKPNREWQGVQRQVAALPFNGYLTRLIPNHDGTADVFCALSYDLADINEQLAFFAEADRADDFERYLDYVSWGYTNLRIRAAVHALRARAFIVDPFKPRRINARNLRFVTWRPSSRTHASEDAAAVRGASTLCGGRLAFHKHTQQQWTCYACEECRCLADGVEYKPRWPPITLVVRDDA